MSFLVSLNRNEYQNDAMNSFDASSGYSLGNARALMWMSQLAYETDDRDKIDDVLAAWNLTRRAFHTDDPITGLPLHSACVVVAGGRGATIVSFAGTDPLKVSDWITDFTVNLSADDLHSGFEQAVGTVWNDIKGAIANRATSEQALFFTGHSLGGALALIAAARALRDPAVNARAAGIYVYGSPRVGGTDFFNAYTPVFGASTFRLVHGTDIVATVPPFASFRHVGRAIQCESGGIFSAQTPMLDADSDKPRFAESTIAAAQNDLKDALAGNPFPHIGVRPLAQAARFLPRMIRDHVPDSYFRALSTPLN